MTASNGLFALIILAAVSFFSYNVQRLIGFLRFLEHGGNALSG